MIFFFLSTWERAGVRVRPALIDAVFANRLFDIGRTLTGLATLAALSRARRARRRKRVRP